MRSAPADNPPHFIGLGPEKTGTTWYTTNLRSHPDVWIPPVKELRYFWEYQNYPDESPLSRVLHVETSWHRRQYRSVLRRYARRCLRQPRTAFRRDAIWVWRYVFLRHDHAWYRRSFAPGAGKVCGEVSPQYFYLSEPTVADIARDFPHLKLVITLRRPADWAWSFIRMNIRTGHTADDLGAIDRRLSQLMTVQFAKTIEKWRRHFPEHQLLILFYDEIQMAPRRFMERLCDFIGVDPAHLDLEQLAGVVNKGVRRDMPDAFRDKLESAWRSDLERLKVLVPGMPDTWLGG